MTPHQPPLPTDGAALVEAHAVIVRLLDQCLTFTSPNGAHKALRSSYSPRGVCQTTKGCSPLCEEYHAAVAAGAAWLDRNAGEGE